MIFIGGENIEDLTLERLVNLAQTGHYKEVLEEARRRDMCAGWTTDRENTKDSATNNFQQNMVNSSSKKYTKGEVVYIRAIITEVGSCGQIGVAVRQPGHNVEAQFIPDEREIFHAKSKTIVTLESK